MTYEAVLFDMDGVLLAGSATDPGLYRRATERVLADYGVELDRIPETVLQPPDIESFRAGCAAIDVPPAEVWRRRDRATCDLENRVIAAGGRKCFEDIDVLAELTGPTGIVSNNRQGTVQFVVEHFALPVDIAIGRDPTFAGFERRKPDPAYIDEAVAKLGVRPTRSLYVGDRHSDVHAARAADLDAALLARNGVPAGESDPDYVVNSLRDLPM